MWPVTIYSEDFGQNSRFQKYSEMFSYICYQFFYLFVFFLSLLLDLLSIKFNKLRLPLVAGIFQSKTKAPWLKLCREGRDPWACKVQEILWTVCIVISNIPSVGNFIALYKFSRQCMFSDIFTQINASTLQLHTFLNLGKY